ncbi:Uncharacterized protein OBRU01_18987 [Operophtera brumata]|uniref:Uncharacterized protein n=1 Tax=Operophtera brumata TaxID=104452 RepID=A0A0L7KYK5_OPEBR|nr:Uncharacterized protein OBRU01_18987 [Operophtera brumata]
MAGPVLFFLGLLGGIVICCVWCFLCRRNSSRVCSISYSCCSPTRRGTEADSAGSLYPPPRYSRCGSFHQAPPPYSEDQQYDLPHALALRRELLDCEMYCEGRWRMPVLGTSPNRHRRSSSEDIVFEPEAYGVRHVIHPPPAEEPCESPTSPKQTKDSIRRPNEDRRQRRLDSIKRNIRKSSLYMPLSTAHAVKPSRISPGARASSRSAPATPCSNLVPNLLNFTHRASRHSSRSSRLEEEYDSLLLDTEQSRMDHKF